MIPVLLLLKKIFEVAKATGKEPEVLIGELIAKNMKGAGHAELVNQLDAMIPKAKEEKATQKTAARFHKKDE